VTAVTAVISYTVRACMPARRWTALAVLFAACLAFGLLAHVPDGDRQAAFARVASGGLFGLVLPLAALVIGDAVLGADIRRGTFVFTWLSPVSLLMLTLGRWLGGSAVAVAALAPAFALAAVVGGSAGAAAPAALAASAGAVAYVALFIAIAAVTRRSTLVALLWVFLFERLLGTALTGIAQLSPTWEARAVFTGLADVPGDLVRRSIPSGWSAVGRLCIITVLALLVARWRLGRLRLTGPAD
jgi:ABC-2 type transport system permease protein